MGVPVKLGATGIEAIIELDLTEEERGWLAESAEAVREVVGVLTA
jgi:malate dehydrogenase